ncbi:DJ-1/PfpI family protein, partial [Nocardiopsis sediminis]
MAEPVVGILLFPGVDEADALDPWGVLSYWAAHGAVRSAPRVVAFTRDGAPVECAGGLRVAVDHAASEAPDLAALVHPGGIGAYPLSTDRAHLAWLRRQRERTAILAGVRSGALVLAAAGALRERRATTHWGSLGALARLDGTVAVVADADDDLDRCDVEELRPLGLR